MANQGGKPDRSARRRPDHRAPLERREARRRIVIGVMVGLMVLSLFVGPLLSLLSG